MPTFFQTALRACRSTSFYQPFIHQKSKSKEVTASPQKKKQGHTNVALYMISLMVTATVLRMILASAYVNPIAWNNVDHRAILAGMEGERTPNMTLMF